MCEDKCREAEGESLSPQEGQASQLRGKDMPSDGWQKAIVTMGNGREYAAPRWGPVAPGMTDRQKEGKAQICKAHVCTHGTTNRKLAGTQTGRQTKTQSDMSPPQPQPQPTGQMRIAEQQRQTGPH